MEKLTPGFASISTDKLKTHEILFTSPNGKRVGSITVVNNKFVFNPPLSNLNSSSYEGEGGGIDLDGNNYSDYIYWNSDSGNNGAWAVDGNRVHIGTNAGKLNQGDFSIALGAYAGQENQGSNSIVINASGEILNGTSSNCLFIDPIRKETVSQLTGTFEYNSLIEGNGGVTSDQSTNVLSYNPTSKEVTYRDLGLYTDTIPDSLVSYATLDGEGVTVLSAGEMVTVANQNIIPKINALTAPAGEGLSLGAPNARWEHVYAKDLHMGNQTFYITNPDTLEEMSIQYDPSTLNTTITNGSFTVKGVTTSVTIPGQIDANLLPFSGFSFIGELNPLQYTKNVGTNFDDQTLWLLYTIRYPVITYPFTYGNGLLVSQLTNMTTDNLFQRLGGAYYTVSGLGSDQVVNLTVSSLTAMTNLTTYNKSAVGQIVSPFETSNTKTLSLGNNDMLIMSVGLQPNEYDDSIIELKINWTLIVFKIPVNGITTFNLSDGIVTNPKLATNAVSTRTLQSGSVTHSKLASYAVKTTNIDLGAVTYSRLSSEVQEMLNRIGSGSTGTTTTAPSVSLSAFNELLQNFQDVSRELTETKALLRESNSSWEKRFLAVEEYIRMMTMTYEIVLPTSGRSTEEGNIYNFTAKDQQILNPISVTLNIDRDAKLMTLTMDEYTYNTFEGQILITTTPTSSSAGEVLLTSFDRLDINSVTRSINVSLGAPILIYSSLGVTGSFVYIKMYNLSENIVYSHSFIL